MNEAPPSRRGWQPSRKLWILVLGGGLTWYLARAPGTPIERRVTYSIPAVANGELRVRWSEADSHEVVSDARFSDVHGHATHTVNLPDGDYLLEAELPNGRPCTRRLHLDATELTIPLE